MRSGSRNIARDEDRSIHNALSTALAQRMPAAAEHITITVEEGIVHIWGILGGENEKAKAREIAAAIPNVRSVQDHRREWAWSD